MSVCPECPDEDCFSRRMLLRLHCCGEREVADTPRHSQCQNDPESFVRPQEDVEQRVLPGVAVQPHHQSRIASALLAYELRPTTERLRGRPPCGVFCLRIRFPHRWLGSLLRQAW